MHTSAIGFDRDRYLTLQSEQIAQRRRAFGGKLYLEFGGKLFDDHHASRVLPGFAPDTKVQMLRTLAADVEILVVISALDLVRNKVRADTGITYETEVLRMVDAFRAYDLMVGSVVLTHWSDELPQAVEFKRRLEKLGLRVYRHYPIAGYPNDVARIVSDQGFGRNEHIETERDIVVVTAPGPGSGKMATCLSQLFHDHQRGLSSGYAKYETFPVWNLPLDHPVNLAYEAATADLDDVNLIDPYHLAAYGEQAVNYNRDVDVFPVLRRLFDVLYQRTVYESPTDMGVNMAGLAISDDAVCRRASEQEVIRRWFGALVDERRSSADPLASDRIARLMSRMGLTEQDRAVVAPARALAAETESPAAAIQLHDGTILTGKTSALLGSSSALLLNALKHLAGIDPALLLLSRESIEPIQELKTRHLGSSNPRLHTDEVLIALSTSARFDEAARRSLEALSSLRGCDVHSSVILGSVDEGIFRSLGLNVTCDPRYSDARLYRKR